MDVTRIASISVSSYSSYSQTAVAGKTAENGSGEAAVAELGAGAARSASAYGPTVEAMKREAEARYENLRAMVQELIARQRGHGDPDAEAGPAVTPETIEQAKTDIAAGGYYSPEATSTRILDYAKALSGGDAGKFKLLKDAVEKGFADASAALGGTLPDISRQTYDLVQKGFDQWAEELGVANAAQG